MASPSSEQHVALLALAVVRAHAVDAAASEAVRRSLALVDICKTGNQNVGLTPGNRVSCNFALVERFVPSQWLPSCVRWNPE